MENGQNYVCKNFVKDKKITYKTKKKFHMCN